MCECLDCPKAGALKIKTNRRKLWEVDGRWMCAVVGTCLSVPELRRLAHDGRVSFPDGAPSDYQLHGAVVGFAKQPCQVARLAHKLLERKFAVQIGRFARVGCPSALERLWQEAKAKGEVPGAYWALVTHPLLPAELGERLFGEIHMMSHLAGAAFRAELRRQGELEGRVVELEAELRAARAGAARAIAGRDSRIRGLEHAAARLPAVQERAEALQQRLDALETGAERRALLVRLEAETGAQARMSIKLEAAEARAAVAEAEVRRLRSERDDLREENATLRAAASGLQDRAANDLTPDLVGRCVLYVGGRDRLMPHLQAAVRRCNGELMHHDGGLSDGAARLDGALERADVVVCPIDCVSHDAVDRIKQACRRCDKPFVPLRGMGVAAFLRGLRTVAPAPAPAQVQAAE